jgi:hypothetical protein
MWVFGQALIINIPILDEEIGHLQGKGQFFFFACEEFFPNPPSSLSLLEYSKATTLHFSSNSSPPI